MNISRIPFTCLNTGTASEMAWYFSSSKLGNFSLPHPSSARPSSSFRQVSGMLHVVKVQVLQEEQPRRLLGVVKLSRAPGFFPEDVVDVLEGLFEHLCS